MKKYILIGLTVCLVLSMCVLFASCGGDKTPQPCEVHIDENVDDICDVCQTPIGPPPITEEELIEIDRQLVVDELNAFFASGVSLINGDRTLPTMNADISIESNLPSEHFISRLQSFHIVDGRIKMVLKNNNPNASAETKDVYIGIMPSAIYCIEDDTTRLDYTTHLYTLEQSSVIVKEMTIDDLQYDDDLYAYIIDHEYLMGLFKDILMSDTAMAINHGLYDDDLLNRLIPKIQSTTSVAFDREQGYIYDLNIHLYIEEGSMKTDIGTIKYVHDPYVTSFSMSLNLNHMIHVDFMKTPTDEDGIFDQEFSFKTECPGKDDFNPIDVSLRSTVSEKEDEAIVINNDIIEQFNSIENRLVYTEKISEKYNANYILDISIDFNWDCREVYIYDERYDVYVLFGPESENDDKVIFKSIEFDCELDSVCFGIMSLSEKRIYVNQHSNKELIRRSLSNKYTGYFTSSDDGCSSIAIFDDEYGMYVLFTQTYSNNVVEYVYDSVAEDIDLSKTCTAKVDLNNYSLFIEEHNTNHTLH